MTSTLTVSLLYLSVEVNQQGWAYVIYFECAKALVYYHDDVMSFQCPCRHKTLDG